MKLRIAEIAEQYAPREMKLRIAEISDITEIAELWEKLMKEIGEHNCQVEWYKINLGFRLQSPDNFVILAENGRSRGFLEAHIYANPVTGKIHGCVSNMFMEKPHVADITKHMIDAARKIGKARKVEVIEILVGNDKCDSWVRKGWKPVRHYLTEV